MGHSLLITSNTTILNTLKPLKRSKILGAATKFFAEKGYQYATISDIAKETGISTGLLYSYFKNKLDLLLSVVLSFWQKINRLNQEKLLSMRNPFDKLMVVLHNIEDLLINDERALYTIKVLNEALPHIVMIKEKQLQEKRQGIIAENKKLLDTIDKIIAEGQKKRQEGAGDSELLKKKIDNRIPTNKFSLSGALRGQSEVQETLEKYSTKNGVRKKSATLIDLFRYGSSWVKPYLRCR